MKISHFSLPLLLGIHSVIYTTVSEPIEARSITSTGIVEPVQKVTLASTAIGRIKSININVGDRVRAGAVLVSINADKLQADLAAAQARSELAQNEEAYLQKLKQRFQRLKSAQSIGADKVDESIFNHAAAKAKVKIAEAQIRKIKAELADTIIKAPFEGVITEKIANIGQVIQPGEPLLTLEQQSVLKLRALVKENYINSIKSGEEAIVTIDALSGESLVGKVDLIVPSANPKTHAFEVEISLPSRKGLFPGMYGKIEFQHAAGRRND